MVLIWWIISHSWKLIVPRLFASSTPALLCSPVTAVTDYLIRLCLSLWPQIDVFGVIINVQLWLHLSEDLFDSVYIHFTKHNNIGLNKPEDVTLLVCHISGLSQYSFGVDFKLNVTEKETFTIQFKRFSKDFVSTPQKLQSCLKVKSHLLPQ